MLPFSWPAAAAWKVPFGPSDLLQGEAARGNGNHGSAQTF